MLEPGDEINQYDDANSQYDAAIDDAITSAMMGEEDSEDSGG
jgi:hypothetical protein